MVVDVVIAIGALQLLSKNEQLGKTSDGLCLRQSDVQARGLLLQLGAVGRLTGGAAEAEAQRRAGAIK